MTRLSAHVSRLDQGGRAPPLGPHHRSESAPPLTSGATFLKMRDAYLPYFAGFYNTHWEDLLSHSEDCDAQMLAQLETGDGALEEDDFKALYETYGDSFKHCLHLTRHYCASFDEHISKSAGFEVGLAFRKMSSPEFYNFETDRIDARIPRKSVRRLFAMSEAEGHRRLKRAIRDWFTPRDGFMPFYSADAAPWLAKPVDDWDRNELCVLLDPFVDPDIDRIIFDGFDEGQVYDAFEKSIDWKKFDRKVAALRRKRR